MHPTNRLTLAIAFALAASATATAQDAVDDATALDKVVVYGDKSAQSLDQSTTSIEVVTQERIEQLNALELDDVLARVGNAGFTSTGSGRNDQFTLRGVSSSGVTPSATPVATLYLDGAPIPDTIYNAALSNAWDVEQFEIYRGAQSTLQGRNSLIGAIYIRTVDPTEEGDLRGRFIGSRFGAYEASIAGGGAVQDDVFFLRGSAQFSDSDGFVERLDGSDGDPKRTRTGRLKARVNISEQLTMRGSVLFTRDEDGNPLVDGSRIRDRVQTANLRGVIDREAAVGSLSFDYALNPAWALTSQTTFADGEVNDFADFDGLPDVDNAFVDPYRQEQDFSDDFTQEFLLRFSGERLNAVGGLYYSKRGSDQTTEVQTISPIPPVPLSALGALFGSPTDLNSVYRGFGFARAPTGAPDFLVDPRILGSGFESQFDGTFNNDFTTRAAFAQLNYAFTDSLTGILGLRYENERAEFKVRQLNTLLDPGDRGTLAGTNSALIGGIAQAITPVYQGSGCQLQGLPIPVCAGLIAQRGYAPLVGGVLGQFLGPNFFRDTQIADSDDASVFLPKFGLTYQLGERSNLSLTAQRAYRGAGQGINPVRARVFTFDPEYSRNYELALRTRALDNRLNLSFNAFRIDWTDQQLEVALSSTVQDTEVLNLGRSRLTGLEFGGDLYLSSEWAVFASLAYLDTEIIEDDRSPAQLAGQPNLEGSRFPFAPRFSGSLGVNYGRRQGFNATADVVFQTESEALLPNTVKNDGRTVVNLRLGYGFDRWQVFGFLRNAFDEVYLLNAATAGGSVVVGEPRVFGVGVSVDL
jgi:iron complex outermembrane recepter protein